MTLVKPCNNTESHEPGKRTSWIDWGVDKNGRKLIDNVGQRVTRMHYILAQICQGINTKQNGNIQVKKRKGDVYDLLKFQSRQLQEESKSVVQTFSSWRKRRTVTATVWVSLRDS